jgi:thiaminase/transcriptional activator TenA
MGAPPSPRFTERLRADADVIWAAQHAHPFVRGIADGTLDAERFRHYVRQDYRFLVDYARTLALAAARAPSLEAAARFAELARETLTTEMDLHRAYAAEWGIEAAALERERPGPTTRAYTDFLLRTAALGDVAELVAALLPCMWGYSELGQRLAEAPAPSEERYARWIALYASEEFATLAAWCRDLVDELADGAGASTQEAMREAFLASSRLELAFWEACWRLEPPA